MTTSSTARRVPPRLRQSRRVRSSVVLSLDAASARRRVARPASRVASTWSSAPSRRSVSSRSRIDGRAVERRPRRRGWRSARPRAATGSAATCAATDRRIRHWQSPAVRQRVLGVGGEGRQHGRVDLLDRESGSDLDGALPGSGRSRRGGSRITARSPLITVSPDSSGKTTTTSTSPSSSIGRPSASVGDQTLPSR